MVRLCDAGGPHAACVWEEGSDVSIKGPCTLAAERVQGRRVRAERAPGLVTQFAKMRLEDAKEPPAGTFLPF